MRHLEYMKGLMVEIMTDRTAEKWSPMAVTFSAKVNV